MKRWKLKNIADNAKVHQSDLVSKLLLSRGIVNKEQADNFLHPDLKNLYDPYLLKDMDRAIERIDEAIIKRQKIYIYGDYDVDGITSSAILYRAFKRLGVDINFYIPDRLNEGYGINKEAIDHIHSLAVDLIITVDCGISAIEEVEYAKSLGLDIIITDHHECKNIIPDTIAINPKRHDCSYPYKGLSGCGVAFKLVQALYSKYRIQGYEELLDLVSIGTIADVVDLSDENRIIVKYGLEKLMSTEKVGLKALMQVAGIKEKISAYNVAFQIAPRLNAAGRLSDAKIAVELFITSDENKAMQIAKYLDQENKKRQDIELGILNECIDKIAKEVNLQEDRVIVLASPNWHIGVVGIVASRIVERFHRPTVLFCKEGSRCRGSARSIEGFNMFENLLDCSDLLVKFGGHELAAGMTIEYEKLDEFRKRLNALAKKIDSSYFVDCIDADLEVDVNDLNIQTAETVNLLEPFGMGNPQPLFVLKDAEVVSKRLIGNDRFIKFVIEKDGQKFDCIDFNNKYDMINKPWEAVDLLFNMNINEWNSNRSLQLIIKDIKPTAFKLTNDLKTDYFKHLKNYLSNINISNIECNNINFVKKDIEILKEFAYFNKGHILIGDRNSLDELDFLLDIKDLNLFESQSDFGIILFPKFNYENFNGNKLLIYDFLLKAEDYALLNNSNCDVIHFVSSDKLERLSMLKNLTTFDEKLLIKFVEGLMYNDFVGTVNDLAKKYDSNGFIFSRLLNALRKAGCIDVINKDNNYYIKFTGKKKDCCDIKDNLALNFEMIINNLENKIREELIWI
ncbi:Single-stranded-DNA-specific exonuclease RecJ [Caloramator mitchellensis]|uniref:Single-stranded-DNA-specific exonuclease RecJ n=1 Tax=Caloramator mitchellensis TaxID=908809 RepID=A0A0R3JVH0_CALMK|nr:single-stranded-DNA-specific exonuclease RecJ [Caloramator mitchellensis]KRQ87521.1 Single-stranded-DNA-specific exonuclease RecJ [Caloramator mitchellensis]